MSLIKLVVKIAKWVRMGLNLCLRNIEAVLIVGLISFAAIQYYLRPQSQSLNEVVASGNLRVLIADEPDSLYEFNKRHYGFEYELLSQYAETIGVKLKLDVVPYAELFTLLEGGFGDLAVGGIIDSDYVRRVSRPTMAWYQAKTTVLYKRGTPAPRSMQDLAGEDVLVSSRYYQIRELSELNLKDDHRSEYHLLSAVDRGTARFALSTNYRALNAKHYLPNLNRSFILPDKLDVVWTLPKRHDPNLLESINHFLNEAVSSGRTAALEEAYFKSKKRLSTYDALAIHRKIDEVLPDFESRFRMAARKANIDWELLAAVAYQESHWSNDATSPTGVRGIMQLTTATASFLGVDDRMNMDESIDAAAHYIHRLRSRLPKSVKEPERTWFAIGAYNVGLKHILNAYQKAKKQQLDHTKWHTIGNLLPTLYDAPFSNGAQAKHYVERVKTFTDILRFYDSHLRIEATRGLVQNPPPDSDEQELVSI